MASPERRRRTLLCDELLMEILLRLPAEVVHKFRSVCRKWRALTSTPHFVERHYTRQSVPAILLQENTGCKRNEFCGGMELFLIENWEEETAEMNLRIASIRPKCIEADSWHKYHACFSCDGLVVLKGTFSQSKERGFRSSSTDFVIYNPINQNTVRIFTPGQGSGGEIYGLFFHPTLKEYCILWGLFQGEKVQFKMLNLGSQPRWKEIQAGSSVLYRPNLPPVHMNDALYWIIAACNKNRSPSYPTCEEFIMAFDVTREEFSVMPHPGLTAGCGPKSHGGMDLLKLDMHLSLVQMSCPESSHSNTIIDIWVLTDVAERVWVKSYSINVELEYLGPVINRAIAIVNGELLLQWAYERFYACNLENRSIRKFGRKYVGCWRALAHFKSLVSLRSCMPEVRMEEITRRTTRARNA